HFNCHWFLPPDRPRWPRTPFPASRLYLALFHYTSSANWTMMGASYFSRTMAELSTQAAARSFLIADDHPMVRDALSTALAHAFPGAAMALAGSLAEVRASLERQPETDALLLDLDMPGMDGLTGLALLRSDWPTVPIIVVSAAREANVVRRAYEFGASAYIDKSASLEEIAGTVRAVLDGEIFTPPDAHPADSFAQRANQLTP